jgi:myo-inositol-1(or 4)-monophosphatase
LLQELIAHAAGISQSLELAVHAASEAGKIVRCGSGELTRVEKKGVGDLVSEVDRQADQAACDVLRASSDWIILSEELNADIDPVDNMWIVDPLDASSAFLTNAGEQYPAVLIARRAGGEIDLGVVYFPLTEEWFYAQRGRGAWRNGQRLICPPSDSLNEVWVEMNQYGDAQYETEYFTNMRDRLRGESGARLVTSNVPSSGVAMRIAADEGSLQAAIHDNNPLHVKQGSWDIAAPQVILEEAGGVFLNPRGERTNPFCCEPIIVARSRQLAEEIVKLQHPLVV